MTKYIDRYYLNGELYGIKFAGGGGEGWQPGANTLAYYKLESDLNDYSGNNRNLTTNGTITFADNGYGKNVASFRAKAEIATFPALQSFTFSCYIKDDSLYSGYEEFAYMIKGTNSTSTGWDSLGTSKMLHTGSNQGSLLRFQPTCQNLHWGGSWNDTNWHYIVGTFDDTTGEVYGYLDGQQVFSGTDTAHPTSSITYFCLGLSNNSHSSISEAIVEDRIRTAQEISDYFDQTKSLYGIS